MKTDTQLQLDVIAELGWEPSVNAAQIGVEVRHGIVTLAGHVDSYTERWHAELAAQRVSGVKGLVVELDVTLPGLNRRTDADIARAAQEVLKSWTYLPTDTVKIKVDNGWITLSGEVEWDYQRRAASDAVRHLIGVSGVSDQITLKPKTSSSSVKSEIEAALKRRAAADAQQISVEVRDDEVTLTGIVHSWSARQLASHSAWSTPGVRNVVDNIKIAY
jgi:osmotically-inducible protein OsmY